MIEDEDGLTMYRDRHRPDLCCISAWPQGIAMNEVPKVIQAVLVGYEQERYSRVVLDRVDAY